MSREKLTGERVAAGIEKAFAPLNLGPQARLMMLAGIEIDMGNRNDRQTSLRTNWEGFLESFRQTANMMPTAPRHGNFVPVLVQGTAAPYRLVCGARRVTANNELGFHTWAIVLPSVTETDRQRYINWENNQRAGHTPAEMLVKVKGYVGQGLDQAAIALEVGLSLSTIKMYGRVLKRPDLAEQVLRSGLSMMQIRLLLAESGDNAKNDFEALSAAIDLSVAEGQVEALSNELAEVRSQEAATAAEERAQLQTRVFELEQLLKDAQSRVAAAPAAAGKAPKKGPGKTEPGAAGAVQNAWTHVNDERRLAFKLDKKAATKADRLEAHRFLMQAASEIASLAKKEGWHNELREKK